ncbi:LiaF transmembrane domain-containing protein [Marinifilum sp. RC60d5]|uniref:LiaF transmembrane domain-containing protein n=1 Tax=Marinifilum sp. RC60d5 TaxID=3458414 RepID=UPI004036235E
MRHHHESENKNKESNRIVFGIFLIVFGCLLVLKNMDFIPYYMEAVLFSWPALLFGLGALFYVGKKDKTTGFVLMAVGGIFLLPLLFNWGFHWRGLFWPVILIVVGVFIIRRRNENMPNHQKGTDNKLDYIDELNVFGGGEKMINTKDFKGGKITCLFGGTELNLTHADLAEGTNVIDIFAMFGGCVLIIPSDWDVRVEVSAVLGGVADKRIPTTNYIVEPKKELVIKGFVALGGCEIKSYK